LDQNITLNVHGDLLGQVATGNGITHANEILDMDLYEMKLLDCTQARLKYVDYEETRREDERGSR
jgi:hypothetical protein